MAPLELDHNDARFQVRAYQPGTLKINELTLSKSVIIMPDKLIEDNIPQTAAELTPHSLAIILTMKPDILLIGTGHTHIFLSPDIYGDILNQGIGVEVMSTHAACRTYNALSAEGRNVAAVLIIQ